MSESRTTEIPLLHPARLRKVLGRVRRRFVIETFDVFARPVGEGDAEFENPPGYRFAWATPQDIAACDEVHTELDERERREGIERLELGHTAVIAFHEETAVFTMWVNPRQINTEGIKRRLSQDQVFIYKAYTSPDHRGRKLYKAGMRFVLADLARKGMRELVGYAHVKKAISRKGLARLEFESKGRYWVVEIPGWRHVFLSRELVHSFPEATPRSNVLTSEEPTPRTP